MAKLLICLFLVYLLHDCYGHSGSNNLELQNDADLQAELIPQELNTQFVPGNVASTKLDVKLDSPWRAIIPTGSRTRRDVSDNALVPEKETKMEGSNYKLYSRIASCIALVIAAVIEIVMFVLDHYK